MKFDVLDEKMRKYETAHDRFVPPGHFMVARIDGRNFTKLTKEKHDFEAPFDERLRDYMIATVEHLMSCGFRVIYGYTQSDEISLLFHPQENAFGRKVRKYNSVLAGEASAKFSLLLDDMACFDCRISELPDSEAVKDYFRWRNEDAARNSLNAHCYWASRKAGRSVEDATLCTAKMTTDDKHVLLASLGIDFDNLDNWRKRGVGIMRTTETIVGWNPLTQEKVATERRRLKTELNLPIGDAYGDFILELMDGQIEILPA